MSYRQRVDAEKAKDDAKSEWNGSVVTKESRRFTAEDRVAQKIANEVLKDNHKLRGIHSGASIKKILEKEAKKQLLMEDKYEEPKIATIP